MLKLWINVDVLGLCSAKLRGIKLVWHTEGFDPQRGFASHGNVSLWLNAYQLARIALWHRIGTLIYTRLLMKLK